MKISILIPCHNEEKSIKRCVESCLNQSRPADEVVVVNDGSTDQSAEVLASFGDRIKVITIPQATGNKSYAQERGLASLTGDVFIATDGDTVLDRNFVQVMADNFADPTVAAVGGYVRSLKHNWLTALREIDYVIGQDLHKVAQANIGFLYVIPGCAGAFRRDIFNKYITFDHDIIAEDLDFTFKLHRNYLKVNYEKRAIVYTQDPFTLNSYINQMRRWYGGGWQSLRKHAFHLMNRPANALELSLIYVEGLIFASLLFLFPLINIKFFEFFLAPYLIFMVGLGIYAAIIRRRWDLFYFSPLYLLLIFINAYVFLEQFVKEIILGRNELAWFTPERALLN